LGVGAGGPIKKCRVGYEYHSQPTYNNLPGLMTPFSKSSLLAFDGLYGEATDVYAISIQFFQPESLPLLILV